MAHHYNAVEVLELALAVWVAGPVIVLIWLTSSTLLNLLRRLPASYQHYAHPRQQSLKWRPTMKQIFYIALTLVILGGFFAWTRILTPNSICPEETSATDDYTFIGHKITNFAGANLGTVKNVIVDMPDGHPVYALISFDDPAYYGKATMIALKNKIVPIPWGN